MLLYTICFVHVIWISYYIFFLSVDLHLPNSCENSKANKSLQQMSRKIIKTVIKFLLSTLCCIWQWEVTKGRYEIEMAPNALNQRQKWETMKHDMAMISKKGKSQFVSEGLNPAFSFFFFYAELSAWDVASSTFTESTWCSSFSIMLLGNQSFQ